MLAFQLNLKCRGTNVTHGPLQSLGLKGELRNTEGQHAQMDIDSWSGGSKWHVRYGGFNLVSDLQQNIGLGALSHSR